MRLIHVSAEEGARILAAEEADDWSMDSPLFEEDASIKLNWFLTHGAGYFIAFCCGEAAIPEGLVVAKEEKGGA